MNPSAEIKSPLLSVCMIVRNEESFLNDCLKSVEGIADQIIVLDTGSTDKTKEIAGRFNVEIYDFEWCDDFSSARNASISYARGEWILWLDADERLQQQSRELLRNILVNEEIPVIYKIHIRNYIRGENGFKQSNAHRLFTNHRGIRFSGKIHEQVSPSAAQLGAEERDSCVVLDHHGYALEEKDQNKKNQRNRKLLKKYVRDNPDNAYAHYTLAQHFAMTGEARLAKASYTKAYDLNQFSSDMMASLLNTMSENSIKLKEFDNARDCIKKSIEMFPQQVGGYYLMYKIANLYKNIPESLLWLEKVAQYNGLNGRARKISTDVFIDPDKLSYHLGTLYLQCNKDMEAFSQLDKVGKDSEVGCNRDFLQKKLEASLRLSKWNAAENILNQLNKNNHLEQNNQEILGIVLMKQQKFADAVKVFQNLHESHPGNIDYIKKLAGLHAKMGDISISEMLVAKINGLQK